MTIYHEAAASVRLDDCTRHESTGDCCLEHARERIRELEGRRCEMCAAWQWSVHGGDNLGICEVLSLLRAPLQESYWLPNHVVYTTRTYGCREWRAKEQG